MRRFVLALPLGLALAAAPALADEIKFPGKSLANVEIVSETYEEVAYKIAGSIQKEATPNIVDIVRTAGKSTRYIGAERKMARGDWKGAVADFTQISTNERLKDEEKWMKSYAQFYAAECYRNMGANPEAIAAYQSVLEDNPKSRFYAQVKLGIGACKMASGDRAGARQAFAELEGDARSKKLGERWANEANFRLAEISEGEDKVPEALERYRKVQAASAGQKGNAGQRAQINVSRLSAKMDPSKADFASNELEKLVAAENANAAADPEVLAAAYNALGDVYAAKGDHKKSLLSYLRVATVEELKAVQSEAPKALYGASVEFEKTKGDDWKVRSDQLKAQLKAMYPSSIWARKVG